MADPHVDWTIKAMGAQDYVQSGGPSVLTQLGVPAPQASLDEQLSMTYETLRLTRLTLELLLRGPHREENTVDAEPEVRGALDTAAALQANAKQLRQLAEELTKKIGRL